VGRWKEDCGCSTGGREGWNQEWRSPLREALDFLRDELGSLYEKEGEKIFNDVWGARNAYIDVILDRSPERMKRFYEKFGAKNLDEKERTRGLKLLEMERHTLLMYTSCGWFFADLSGLETVQILKYASRAIQLAEELSCPRIEEKFVESLSRAKSNLPGMTDGRKVYQTLVKPASVTLEKVVNHFAISSFLAGEEKGRKIFSYQTEVLKYEKMKREDRLLVLGQVSVSSEIIPEAKEFLFGLIPSKKDIFRTWVSEHKGEVLFDTLKEKGAESLAKDEEEMARVLTSLLGNRIFTLRDVLKEERQTIFQKLIEKDLKEHLRIYAELYERSKQLMEALAREGFEIPYEIRVAAEVTLSDRLLKAVMDLQNDLKGNLQRGDIGQIFDEAKSLGYHLRKEEAILFLKDMLMDRMGRLSGFKENPESGSQEEEIEALVLLLDQVRRWGLEIPKEEAQDLMDEILDEHIGGMEESWWGEGKEKPFSRSLILLAEKLDFNVEKFSKMAGSAGSKVPQ
jgi:alpha-amylase/alpha-mannosidase (GH57 family)